MTSVPKDLRVTSHIGRDLLQAAAPFKTEASVVWEYVVNSLQYVDRRVAPVVDVRVMPRANRIAISDNGRGMDAAGLQHFFTMHGENIERRAGRPGRGKFGTGKSAAFGIANVLEVDTVRGGRRNAVQLTRAAVEASGGEEIPIDWIVRDQETDRPNGTTVTIQDVLLPRIETSAIIEYIERHLPHFRMANPQVAVNNHVCEYREPKVVESFTFRTSSRQAEVIGDIELLINVAQAPLPDADQGIAVTSGPGNLVAIERGGVEKKEFGAYLFGEVDVPAIEESSSPIAPYDATRSLQLNPRHPVVAVLIGFIGSKLDEVRNALAERERQARRTEEARRLANEASQIADILNQDFNDQLKKLRDIHTATSAATGTAQAMYGDGNEAGHEEDAWVSGTDQPGLLDATYGRQGHAERKGRPDPEVTATGTKDPEGEDLVSPAGGVGKRKRPKGGFRVEYKNLGEEEDRSRYDSSAMTILINLDHPVVAAALGGGSVEAAGFRRLSYEIAFGEYAIALGYEMASHDPEIPADDLLYEVRTTLNRVARSSASLYR